MKIDVNGIFTYQFSLVLRLFLIKIQHNKADKLVWLKLAWNLQQIYLESIYQNPPDAGAFQMITYILQNCKLNP